MHQNATAVGGVDPNGSGAKATAANSTQDPSVTRLLLFNGCFIAPGAVRALCGLIEAGGSASRSEVKGPRGVASADMAVDAPHFELVGGGRDIVRHADDGVQQGCELLDFDRLRISGENNVLVMHLQPRRQEITAP